MTAISSLLKGITRPHELIVAQRQTPTAGKLLAGYAGIGWPSFPFDIQLRDGGVIRVFSPGETKVFWSIFVQRCYRLWTDCKTIVDAGANIGVFSIWAGRQLPQARIFALEPHPETFAKLQHNLQANRLGNRVQALQFALAAESGERDMLSGTESQRRSLVPADCRSAETGTVKVPSVTLAELMESNQLEQIDMMKMDIEGSEWEVLLSTPPSVLRRIRRIQFEYHEVAARFGYSKAKLFKHLSSAGLGLTHCHEDRQGTGIAVMEQ
jgi:FkbM family methyltransferase